MPQTNCFEQHKKMALENSAEPSVKLSLSLRKLSTSQVKVKLAYARVRAP